MYSCVMAQNNVLSLKIMAPDLKLYGNGWMIVLCLNECKGTKVYALCVGCMICGMAQSSGATF